MSQQLGFEDFVAEVEESNKDFKQAQKVCLRALCLVPCIIGRVTDLDVTGACTITTGYKGHDRGRTAGTARTPVCV